MTSFHQNGNLSKTEGLGINEILTLSSKPEGPEIVRWNSSPLPPDSILYEADESGPESPSPLDIPANSDSSSKKSFLNSYVLIGPERRNFNGKKRRIFGNLTVNGRESSRSESETPPLPFFISPGKSTGSFLRLTAHYDLDHSTGSRRGVEAKNDDHLSFLSVALFALFYFSNSCDSWILNESEAKLKVSRKATVIRKLLSQEIIFSMRMSYFCPQHKVHKLYSTLFPHMSTPQSLEIGKFLAAFLGNTLSLSETTHYTSTTSEIIVTLKALETSKDDNVTLQHLLEVTMKEKDRTLLSIPRPALFLSLPSTLTSLPHGPFVPNLQLDLSPFLIRLRHDDDSTSSSGSDFEILRSYRTRPSPKKPSMTDIIKESFTNAYAHLQVMVETLPQMFSPGDNYFYSVGDEDHVTPSRNLEIPNNSSVSTRSLRKNSPLINSTVRLRPEVLMDLMAVICRDKNCNYTAFVRCGHNPRRGFSPWAFFNPSGDSNLPQVQLLDRNFTKSLRKLGRLKQKKLIKEEWKRFPKEIHTLLSSSTFFIYDTKPTTVFVD